MHTHTPPLCVVWCLSGQGHNCRELEIGTRNKHQPGASIQPCCVTFSPVMILMGPGVVQRSGVGGTMALYSTRNGRDWASCRS
jgi:hypothetical protein